MTGMLAGCGVPPLHRSVVVETDSSGVPVHAAGEVNGHDYTVVRGDTIYSIAVRTDLDYHQLARWNGIRSPYIIHPGQVLRLTRPRNIPAPQPAQAPVFHTVSSGQSSARQPARVSKSSSATTASTGAAASAATSPAISASTVVAVAGQPPVATPKPTPKTTDHDVSPNIPAQATRGVGGIQWRWPAEGKVLSRFNPADANPGINIGGDAGEPVRAAAGGVVVYSGNGLVGYGELVVIKHNDDYLSIYGHNSKRLVKEGEHVQAGQVIAHMGSTGAPRDELEFQIRYKGKPVDPLKYLPSR